MDTFISAPPNKPLRFQGAFGPNPFSTETTDALVRIWFPKTHWLPYHIVPRPITPSIYRPGIGPRSEWLDMIKTDVERRFFAAMPLWELRDKRPGFDVDTYAITDGKGFTPYVKVQLMRQFGFYEQFTPRFNMKPYGGSFPKPIPLEKAPKLPPKAQTQVDGFLTRLHNEFVAYMKMHPIEIYHLSQDSIVWSRQADDALARRNMLPPLDRQN